MLEIVQKNSFLCIHWYPVFFPENKITFNAWEPTNTEISLLQENPKRRKVTGNTTIGILVDCVLRHVPSYIGNIAILSHVLLINATFWQQMRVGGLFLNKIFCTQCFWHQNIL